MLQRSTLGHDISLSNIDGDSKLGIDNTIFMDVGDVTEDLIGICVRQGTDYGDRIGLIGVI